jgi:hypothetical protein
MLAQADNTSATAKARYAEGALVRPDRCDMVVGKT